MSAKSITEVAEELGIVLLPWQREYAEALDRGERPILVGGKRTGRTTMRKIIAMWEELNR